MSKFLRIRRPSPAMVIACIALIAALSGGAYAAGLKKNSVGTPQLKPGAVATGKIKNGAVTKQKLAPAARIRWARIDGVAGTVIDQSGGISVEKAIVGVYYVDFGSSTAGKGLLATNVDPGDGNDDMIVHVRRCGPGAGDLQFCDAAKNTPRFVHVETNGVNPPALGDGNFTIALLP